MGTSASSRANIAIFASGTGSNALALLKHARELGSLSCIKAIITDNPQAGVLQHAREYNVKAAVFPIDRRADETFAEAKRQQEQMIHSLLQSLDVKWVLLAGYMRILSPGFLELFYNSHERVNQVVNIHPSALPAFPGKDGYGDAFSAGVKNSGVTIHFVDAGVDSGPVIDQQVFPRLADDTLESFKSRGLALEHLLYPQVLEMILNETIFSKGCK